MVIIDHMGQGRRTEMNLNDFISVFSVVKIKTLVKISALKLLK